MRRSRLRSSVLYFPVLLLIFVAIGAGVIFIRGHLELQFLQRVLGEMVSERAVSLVLWGVVLIVGTGSLLFLLWQRYQECRIEKYLFCETCKAVDTDETGHCPVCSNPLSDAAGFFYTSDSDEEKLLKRRGLQPYRNDQ